MAAAVNQTGVSASSEEICLVVNRWLVDHYVDLAIKAFKDNEYDTFCTLRDVLDGEFSECFRLVVRLFSSYSSCLLQPTTRPFLLNTLLLVRNVDGSNRQHEIFGPKG